MKPRLGVLVLLGLMLSGCWNSCSRPATMGSLHRDGILRVATRNGSTTYYLDRHEQPIGPEYDLVSAFASAHGWQVEWTMYDSTAEVLQSLEHGTTHLAAAGLTHMAARDAIYARGPAHTEVIEQLVCHRDRVPFPRTQEDLSGLDIHVTAKSSYVATLSDLQEQIEGIRFVVDELRTTEILLSQVAEQKIDCVVADSNIVEVTRRHWPHLQVAMNLGDGQNLGWYLPNQNQELADMAREWMNSEAGNLALRAMENRYYSYIGDFDFVDLRTLHQRIDERLPHFMPFFVRAEKVTGMSALLLAALAYQESHWDPDARSPTGVRGIMMLTLPTAESLGVNRLDPVQAIMGGAEYLAELHRRLPESVAEPDRTYLALASYNIGRGHLLDVRQLARDLGKNPDSWADMREVLPLKADKRYYPGTRYGYARGYEPVHYVQRIRNYKDVIVGRIAGTPHSPVPSF